LCPTDGNANCYSHLKIYEVLQKIKPKTATWSSTSEYMS
jgi:hypothetical protein